MDERIRSGTRTYSSGKKRKIILKIGQRILVVGLSFTKVVAIYSIFLYFSKYPNQLIIMPKKLYKFSRRFYDSLEIYIKRLFKKSKVVNVVDKGKDIIVEFVDKNTYYDLDDRLNSKFYKTSTVIAGLLAFIFYNYLGKKPPNDDHKSELLVDAFNEIFEDALDNN